MLDATVGWFWLCKISQSIYQDIFFIRFWWKRVVISTLVAVLESVVNSVWTWLIWQGQWIYVWVGRGKIGIVFGWTWLAFVGTLSLQFDLMQGFKSISCISVVVLCDCLAKSRTWISNETEEIDFYYYMYSCPKLVDTAINKTRFNLQKQSPKPIDLESIKSIVGPRSGRYSRRCPVCMGISMRCF